jgi:competence protein ComEC
VFSTIFVVICCLNKIPDESINMISTTKHLSLKVFPDELRVIDNNGYYGIMHDNNNDCKYLVFGKNYKSIANYNQPFQISVRARLTPISIASNFNQFDSKEYYKIMGVSQKASIENLTTVKIINDWSLVNFLHAMRMKCIHYFNSLPYPVNLYANSLFLGDMDDAFNNELSGIKSLGLIHLFSISGLHVYYIVSLVTLILRLLRITREKIRLILLLILPNYFILAGSSIGLLRSIIAVEIGVLFKCFNSKMSSLDIWSITFIVNLFLQPNMLLQFGCQLSYILAFGLIFTSHMKPLKQTMIMNLISLPLIMYKLFTWHLLTIIANYLVIPIFSIIIMPGVLMAIIAYPVLPLVTNSVSILLVKFDQMVNMIGKLPGNILFGKPHLLLATLLVLVTFSLIAKYSKVKVALLICIYVVTFISIHYPIEGEVSFFDVGQGDSILIREPFNKSISLIDTGGKINFNKKQPPHYQADKISINYLNSIGINHLDNLALSHQDADHTGDVPIILQKMKVKNLIIIDGMQNNYHFMKKINPYLKTTRLITVRAGYKVNNFPFVIYHPWKSGLGDNADSMVLGLSQGGKTWLFTGDLPSTKERILIQKYPNLKIDILKLGHHGSSTSTSIDFLKFLQPQVAIVSAGRNNRYNHPSVETLQRLGKQKIPYFNTQNQGMISYRYSFFGNRWITKLQGD